MDAALETRNVEAKIAESDDGGTSQQSGSVSFPDLVRAHWNWERAGGRKGDEGDEYHKLLKQFTDEEGDVVHAYWAKRRPSAVALTIKRSGRVRQWFSDHDCAIRLHRATDWLAKESAIADLMHHCDTLAMRVSEVLKGSSERIAMQWIYAVQSHMLGFVERTNRRRPSEEASSRNGARSPEQRELDEFVERQKAELIEIERYYDRAATKQARIVYFWGMVIGVLASGVVGVALAGVVWLADWFDEPNVQDSQSFFVCFVAGTLGAFVSVLMRMSSNSFRVDYEVGRSTIRRLGSFRPFIGAVFGMALFFLVMSGILNIQLPPSSVETFFFLGSLAFLAGFNERWTNVILGRAQQTIATSLGPDDASKRKKRDDEDDERG
jgi:hypothetical protein